MIPITETTFICTGSVNATGIIEPGKTNANANLISGNMECLSWVNSTPIDIKGDYFQTLQLSMQCPPKRLFEETQNFTQKNQNGKI